jgi:hypothetical protein
VIPPVHVYRYIKENITLHKFHVLTRYRIEAFASSRNDLMQVSAMCLNDNFWSEVLRTIAKQYDRRNFTEVFHSIENTLYLFYSKQYDLLEIYEKCISSVSVGSAAFYSVIIYCFSPCAISIDRDGRIKNRYLALGFFYKKGRVSMKKKKRSRKINRFFRIFMFGICGNTCEPILTTE